MQDLDGDQVFAQRVITLDSNRLQRTWLYGLPPAGTLPSKSWLIRLIDQPTGELVDQLRFGVPDFVPVNRRVIGITGSYLLGLQPYMDTTGQPINYGQVAMPRFLKDGWALIAGAPMLKFSTFMPNHAKIGQFNGVIYKDIQAVETDRLEPADAAAFVMDELESELGDDVILLD